MSYIYRWDELQMEEHAIAKFSEERWKTQR